IDEDPNDTPTTAYSIDAFQCGNWTRFINHSCSANTRIIAVAHGLVAVVVPLFFSHFDSS
ncbi:hypothetical protein B0H14DRAFT_2865335, partial [Mycena olivaceomarginata]